MTSKTPFSPSKKSNGVVTVGDEKATIFPFPSKKKMVGGFPKNTEKKKITWYNGFERGRMAAVQYAHTP